MSKKTKYRKGLSYCAYKKDGRGWKVEWGGRSNRKRRFFYTRDEAERWMDSTEGLAVRGILPPPKTDCPRVSVESAVEWYTKTHIETSPSEFAKVNEPLLLRHFSNYFQGNHLHEVKLKNILEFRESLRTGKHGQRKPQTINRILNSTATFWRVVAEVYKVPNACDSLKKLKEEPTKVHGITEEEAKMVQEQISEHFKAPLKIICVFALRRSEALNLTATDVNEKERVLTIRATKTNSIRDLPIPNDMLPLLVQLKQEALKREPPHFLFVNTLAKKFDPWHFSRKVRNTNRKVLGQKRGSTHVYRHGRLSTLVRVTDVETVRQIAGHQSLTTTQRYLDTTVDRKLAALSRGTVPLVATENGNAIGQKN